MPTTRDKIWFAAGPALIVGLWLLLPWPVAETYVPRKEPGQKPSGVLAELVGYAVERPPDGRPLILGRGAAADIRLHQAPVARRAAVLLPPSTDNPRWTVLPGSPGVTLRRLNNANGQTPETSLQPWRDQDHGTVRIGCNEAVLTATPERFQRGVWGLRIQTADGSEQLLASWAEPLQVNGFQVFLADLKPSSFRLGLAADGLCGERPCSRVPVCLDDERLADLGALELAEGDLLAVGRTRFLVRTPSEERLELIHVRNPGSPGTFRASSAHNLYHPNRRALWDVPACGQEQGALRLAVLPTEIQEKKRGASELALEDSQVQQRMTAAARHEGRLLKLPPVTAGQAQENLTACLDGKEILLSNGTGVEHRLSASVETLVPLEGYLLRLAPSRVGSVTWWTRAGLAFFLSAVLLIQARFLQPGRDLQSQNLLSRGRAPGLSLGLIQHAAGIAVAGLLFVGASYQLFLATHPRLAGKPDYAQAFLLGVVLVGATIAMASGLAGAGVTGALGGAAAALLLAGLWWLADGLAVGDEFGLDALRNGASAAASATPETLGGRLFVVAVVLGLAALVASLAARQPLPSLSPFLSWTLNKPLLAACLLAGLGLLAGVLRRSALAFEVAILAAVAWYGAVYWSFVRRSGFDEGGWQRRRTATYSLGTGFLALLFVFLFFLTGSRLPDVLSFVLVAVGLGCLVQAVRRLLAERSTSLLRLLVLWAVAAIFGAGFATVALRDMGSVAAWAPALLAGLALWMVRPEEGGGRSEETAKAKTQTIVVLGVGLVLLGTLDVIRVIVERLDWRLLERPRQRLALAEDVSYITAGEWITQVRWLASHRDAAFDWVPNVNSDVAIFGVAANLGLFMAVITSVLLLVVAACAAVAADLALRRARQTAAQTHDRLRPASDRAVGLFLGMVAVLLVCQWLVHLSTGVVLHLPITGLVFPWISHGNTTHLVFAAALLLPLGFLGSTRLSSTRSAMPTLR